MVIYTDRDGVTHIRTASGAHYVVRNGKYSRVAW